jgi:SAM-dependent methyltransferase
MHNTENSFEDKWANNPDLLLNHTINEGTEFFNWILTRNGFKTPDELVEFLRHKNRILDAGCGNGRVTALLRRYSPNDTEIVGIDLVDSAIDSAKKNLGGITNVSFCKKDILGNLNDLGLFDFIYCQEVLHHTADPKKAFLNLVSVLSLGGEIAIYVYKKKAPVREFVDDFIRGKISGLSYIEAINVCNQITELGKTLSDLKLKVKIPNVNVLEIKEGEYDLQRFIYHFLMKCFWNGSLSFEDNSVINYDWYHPTLCSRHRIETVKEWFSTGGLKIVHECVDFYGITVRGIHN